MDSNKSIIVVGLERSEADHGILSTAVRLAGRMNAKLLLVHAASVSSGVMEAITSPVATLEPEALDEAQTYLDTASKTVAPELLAGAVAGYGVAWSSLCDVAKKHAARLIVMGARGFRRPHLLGSTTAAVVDHSPCSVYVTRDKPGKDTERIMVGVDGSDLSRDVVEAAVSFTHGEQHRVLLFRAIASDKETAEPDVLVRAKADLSVFADLVHERASVTIHARPGVAWRALCDAAHDYEVDVIAIGAHGHGVVKHVLGTTAARVVEHAEQSVLVVKRQSSS